MKPPMRLPTLARLASLTLLAAVPALAQAPSAPSAAPGAAPGATTPAPPNADETPPARRRTRAGTPERQAKSKECSAEADKQGLHGKPRKEFRSKCLRG